MIWIGASDIRAADALRFIPATPENTTLVDGSPVNPKDGEGDWKWLPTEGNQGIFESYGDPKKNAPALLITAKNLEAGRDYEVFGFFWTHGFGAAPATRDKQPFHWPASFGLGLASLTTYGGRFSPDIPWIISPGSNIGGRLGYTAVLEEKNPEIKGEANWITAVDDTRLIRARLGFSRVGKDGTLPVYADDFPDSKFCGRTRIDGIGLRLMPAGDHESVGAGKPGHLHLAVRAGDTRNMRRELAAGADANALDEDGVTALLYPASSGDQTTVHELLKAGANPNQPGQSILPLTGAASWGDTAMVKLLLEAGAEVADKITHKSPLLSDQLDGARLHPAIAAVRAGSLGALKLILEKNPDLNLEKLGPEYDPKVTLNKATCADSLVEDTMDLMHDELAAFLIDRGGKIQNQQLIANCILLGNDMAKSREALLRRGIPAIQPSPYNPYSGSYANESMVEPWDALSAAVFMSDVDLTKRFLPLANQVDERYQQALHALANWSGQPEILSTVRGKFPYKPVEAAKGQFDKQDGENEEALRLFLPRIAPRAIGGKAPAGTRTLAVIASPAAAGPASLVEVRAANGKQWKVVDRAEIEAALKEDLHVKPWEKGEHRLAELGDHLSADVLLLAERFESKALQLLRFEAVDVASGLIVHREYIEEKAFEKETDVMLARIRAAIDKANSGQRPLAISLLSFTANEELPLSKSLASQFRAAAEVEVDSTQGLLTVGMQEIQTIAREQTLKGEGAFWAAAYTLEGGIAALPDNRVSLTLRLRNLVGKSEQSTDARVEGTPQEIPALTLRAWRQLIKSVEALAVAAPHAQPNPAQAVLEAARLAREAEWLINCRKPKEAGPLVERAAMIGAAPELIVPMIFATLIAEIPIHASISIGNRNSSILSTRYPLSLAYQQAVVERFDSIRELLDRAATLHEAYGKSCHGWKRRSADFWYVLNLLSYVRATIPERTLSPQQKDEFASFSKELGLFTEAYFQSLIHARPDTCYRDLAIDPYDTRMASAIMFRKNPELLDGMARSLVTMMDENCPPYAGIFTFYTRETPNTFETKRLFSKAVLSALKDSSGSFHESLKRQLEFYPSRCEKNALEARRILAERFNSRRYELHAKSHYLVPVDYANRYGISRYFQTQTKGLPSRANAYLPAFFHEPKPCPECMVRPGYGFDSSRDEFLYYRLLYKFEISETPKSGFDDLKKEFMTAARAIMRNDLQSDPVGRFVEKILNSIAAYELMFGIDLHAPIAREWQDLSKPKSNNRALNPRILTDLCKGPDPSPGVFDMPIVDSSMTNRLWFRYHPYDGGLAQLGGNMTLRTTKRESWLMALDCQTGKMEKSINISGLKELMQDGEFNGVSMMNHRSAFMFQNSSTILTQVEFLQDAKKNETHGGYALINKENGKSLVLPYQSHICELQGYGIHRGSCVEVVDDNYYLLFKQGPKNDRTKRYNLVMLKSDGSLMPITQSGRKPELTPFDPMDRSPEGLVRDGKRLLMYHGMQRELMGWHDPSNMAWDMSERPSRERIGMIKSAMNDTFQSERMHVWNVSLPDGKATAQIKGDINAHQRVSFPGKIVISSPKKKDQEIPISIPIPDDYKKSATFTEDYSFDQEKPTGVHTCEALLRAGRLHIVVLNQTATDLILGLRIEQAGRREPPPDLGLFIPFLWALPKSEVFEQLGISKSN